MFNDINWLIILAVFLGYIIVDGMYAYYTIAVVTKNAVQASSISFVMHFILAGGVIAYTKDYIYVLPLALGSALGTYLVTKYQDKLGLHKTNNK